MMRLRDFNDLGTNVVNAVSGLVTGLNGRRPGRRKSARYVVRQGDDGWTITFAGEKFGPYKDAFEATMFAIGAAQKLGDLGATKPRVQLLDDRGRPTTVWTYGVDPAGMVAADLVAAD